MPEIVPFQAVHYPWGSDFAMLTAPPYDVISPDERRALEVLHPDNVIRVTLGGDFSAEPAPGKYEAAAETFRRRLAAGILTHDPEPAYFIYGMEYSSGGAGRQTAGLIAALTLEGLGAGEIFPHEQTLPGPKKDRLQLMRTTRANLEPLWFFASSRVSGFRALVEKTVGGEALGAAVDGAGVTHRLWQVAPGDVFEVEQDLSGNPLVIADGHHRYETALTYRDERRAADGPGPWDATLAFIVDPVDYPPLLLPIHRIVEGLTVGAVAELLEGPVQEFEGGLAELVPAVQAAGPGTVGIFENDVAWTVPSRGLDTAFLNDRVLEPSGAKVRYEHDEIQIASAVAAGALAFIMAPAPIGLIAQKALAGERMPPKTTLFWPKPRTGFVMRDL